MGSPLARLALAALIAAGIAVLALAFARMDREEQR